MVRNPLSAAEKRRFLDVFIAAAQKKDFGAMESLLATGIVSYQTVAKLYAPLQKAGRGSRSTDRV